jgi:hypothetical protein
MGEARGASSGLAICRLYARRTKASPLYADYPCRGEAAIMLRSDTKKDVHIPLEIHYNTSRHEHTPRGRGLARVAGQSCLAGPAVLWVYPCAGPIPEYRYST